MTMITNPINALIIEGKVYEAVPCDILEACDNCDFDKQPKLCRLAGYLCNELGGTSFHFSQSLTDKINPQ